MTDTNQGLRQASVRAVTGTTYDYNSDWSALFTAAGIAAGDWNGRMIGWINSQLGTAYTDVNSAMQAYAEAQGVGSWNELGTFTATDLNFLLLENGDNFLLESGTGMILLQT